MIRLAAVVALFVCARPVWTEIGAVNGQTLLADFSKKKVEARAVTVPLCFRAPAGMECKTVKIDCDAWTYEGAPVGPKSIGDAVVGLVCESLKL